MSRNKWQWIVLATAALVIWGCDDSSSSPSTPAGDAATNLVDSAADAANDAPEVQAQPIETTQLPQAPTTPTENEVQDTADAEQSTASALMEKAQPLLDQAMTYLDENKFDLADKALAQLETMQGLPASFMSQVKDARGLLELKMKSDQAEDAAGALQGLMNK
jgi:hypothetical protein